MRFTKVLAVLTVFAALAALPAFGDSIFNLNYDGAGLLTASHPSAGQVTLTNNNNGTVGVSVALNSGFGFIDTGSHDSFTFTLSNPSWTPTITFTGGTSSGWTWGQPGSNSPFGSFGVYIDCNVPGTCGNGGSNPYYGTLTFTVSVSGQNLTDMNFIGNNNNPSIYVASDLYSNWTGKTGAVGSTTRQTTTTPEPASLSLLGAGLFAIGRLMRRKN